MAGAERLRAGLSGTGATAGAERLRARLLGSSALAAAALGGAALLLLAAPAAEAACSDNAPAADGEVVLVRPDFDVPLGGRLF